MRKKKKCEARSKRFFPAHKQKSSRSCREVLEHSGPQKSNVSSVSCFGKRRKTAGNTTRKLKRVVLGRRRPLCSANVLCGNQKTKKYGYSWGKHDPSTKRKTNSGLHCRTKIPRRNKIARSTRKAGRSEKMSCRDSHFGRPPKEKLQVCTSPQPKNWKKAIEMEEGHYLVSRCAMEKSTSEGLQKQFSSSCRLEKTATQ